MLLFFQNSKHLFMQNHTLLWNINFRLNSSPDNYRDEQAKQLHQLAQIKNTTCFKTKTLRIQSSFFLCALCDFAVKQLFIFIKFTTVKKKQNYANRLYQLSNFRIFLQIDTRLFRPKTRIKAAIQSFSDTRKLWKTNRGKKVKF